MKAERKQERKEGRDKKEKKKRKKRIQFDSFASQNDSIRIVTQFKIKFDSNSISLSSIQFKIQN